jgi:hypothetical protein
VVHHRRATLGDADGRLVVEDWLDCRQAHDVELLWHAAAGATLALADADAWSIESTQRRIGLAIEGPAFEAAVIEGRQSPPQGWVSARFYERSAAPVLSVRARLSPGQVLRTTIWPEAVRPMSNGAAT